MVLHSFSVAGDRKNRLQLTGYHLTRGLTGDIRFSSIWVIFFDRGEICMLSMTTSEMSFSAVQKS